ncbi:MAG: NAD(P)-dependent oxidoreductase [Pseudomonadota bacterium]
MNRVSFLGLGVMGYPMAGHLARAGLDVTVYNRTAAKAQAWCRDYSGQSADSPAAAAAGAEMVLVCVGNDRDVEEVIAGPEGALSTLAAGSVLVDHTTASADLARTLSQKAEARGVAFLDAPVSGGQAGAENGALTIMVGGGREAYERAAPVFSNYAAHSQLLGASGSGQLAKMVNQICIAGVVQGLAEGLHFAEHAGLDAAAVVEVISRGAAQSWQMQNRYQTMLSGHYDHGFAVDWMRKDLAMVLAEAERLGITLELTSLVDGYYADVQKMGGGRWDTSSLLARLKQIASQ